MIRATLLFLGLLFGTLPTLPSAGRWDRRLVDLTASIDSFVQRRVASDSFSGVVMFTRNGVPVYQRAAGLADRDRGSAMTINTKLQIASTTKLFTQIAIRQLEQAGKLSLSDTVGKFLPDYPNSVVRRKVTVEQLLRHRSGVGSFWNEKFMTTRAKVRTVQDYLELFQNDSLLFEPGTSEAYSNGGYVLLGAIIERVSGKSYQGYVQEKIFHSAGMTETVPYDSRVSRTNAAVGYTTQPLGGGMTGDRRLAGVGARRAATGGIRRPNTSFQAGVSGPAGDHYSTVVDFLKLANALVSHRLLDSARTAAVLGARYAA
ncbi:MAG: beta-lactamase family protein, partial [Gemmatimonadaceae bacterium]|nr:beta-lactamase family protein [Gemmatimonadaceae bacterium]